MNNDTDKENARTFVKEFLLAEYAYITDSFWKNEQTGETRVNWFIGIVTAAAAGLVGILSAQSRLHGDQLRFIIAASLFSLLVFGIVTLFRIIQRNQKTDGYKRDCDAIRQLFRDYFDKDQILKDYHPFGPKQLKSDAEEASKESKYGDFGKRKFGGLTYLVSTVNSLIFAALIFVVIYNPNLNTIWRCSWVPLLGFTLAYVSFYMIIESESYGHDITHAAGIVFRSNGGKVEYLLVGPKEEKREVEWLLPKGHIEKKEDQRQAAIREVQEETGIKARLVWPLGKKTFKTSKEKITAQYYLMSFVSEGEPSEKRRQGWFTFENALRMLTHKSNKSLLEDAEGLRAAYFNED